MDGKKARAWFLLFRPWSYTATLVPFFVAAALFGISRGANWLHWAGGIVVGLLFQATVNLLNTWGDERSGVDDVPGAIRTTPQVHDGLVSMRAVFAVAATCAILAGAGGLLLCLYSVPDGAGGTAWKLNVELLLAGFLGFLGSTNYSTGIKFKYRGLGVPFVSFLMGPLEIFVAGTLLRPGFGQEFIMDAMSGRLGPALHIFIGTIVTLPVAALVGVIMHGNDMRDIPTDRAAGIVTFASRLGPRSALAYYRICHVVPYAVCFLLMLLAMEFTGYRDSRSAFLLLLPLACLPLTVRTLRIATHVYRDNPQCPKWRGLERASGGIHFLFGMLYAVSLCLWQIAMFKR